MTAKGKAGRAAALVAEYAVKLAAAYGFLYLFCLATHALMALCGVE